MLFNANAFILVFLPLTFMLFHGVRRFSCAGALGVLAFMSLAFYGYGEPRFLLLLLLSIAFNYWLGTRLIGDKDARLLWFGIVVDLCLIGYFKYTHFFLENLDNAFGLQWSVGAIALPLGISFYTFQKIAFLVDAYKSRVLKPTLLEYVLFISFFPQLIAGPIVHFNEVAARIRSREPIPLSMINAGLFLYCLGLAKKSFLADFFAVWADAGFSAVTALHPVQALIATLAYTLQIYFDFSGYSDMAVGLGMMFGILLPVNFNSPYKSRSFVEFWRRWHITLSNWLRDYVYIPLGGRGRFEGQRFANIMVTMLVGGLWHGAGWNFVLWGGLHGFAIGLNHLWLRVRPQWLVTGPQPVQMTYGLLAWLSTLVLVSLLWVLFRADHWRDAIQVFNSLMVLPAADIPAFSMPDLTGYFDQNSLSLPQWLFGQLSLLPFNVLVLAVFFLGAAVLPNATTFKDQFQPGLGRAFLCATIVLVVVAANLFLVTPNAFIYFRF